VVAPQAGTPAAPETAKDVTAARLARAEALEAAAVRHVAATTRREMLLRAREDAVLQYVSGRRHDVARHLWAAEAEARAATALHYAEGQAAAAAAFCRDSLALSRAAAARNAQQAERRKLRDYVAANERRRRAVAAARIVPYLGGASAAGPWEAMESRVYDVSASLNALAAVMVDSNEDDTQL
jgi:hypothetical protein